MGWLDATTQVTLPADMIVPIAEPKIRILSDVHLGRCKGDFQDLVDMLERYSRARSVHLVVLGDFLELLCCPDGEFTHGYTEVRKSLGILAAQQRLTWVIGNHDLRVRDKLFGYREPQWKWVRYFEDRALKDYKNLASKTDLPDLFSMHKGNSHHRYACVQTASGNWLLCHGDEANYGQMCKDQFGKHWMDWLFAMWRTMDAVPAVLLAAGQDIETAVSRLLDSGLSAVFHRKEQNAGRSAATQSFSLADTLDEMGEDDDLGNAFADGVLAHVQAVAEGRSPESAESPELQAMIAGVRAQGLVPGGFTLSDARARLTPPRPDDCASGNPTAISLDGLVIGHRHVSEIEPNLQGPGISTVVDAGAWSSGVDPDLRARIATIEDGKVGRPFGREDRPQA